MSEANSLFSPARPAVCPQILPPPLYNININVQFADFLSASAGAFNQYVQNFGQLLFNVLIESDV